MESLILKDKTEQNIKKKHAKNCKFFHFPSFYFGDFVLKYNSVRNIYGKTERQNRKINCR